MATSPAERQVKAETIAKPPARLRNGQNTEIQAAQLTRAQVSLHQVSPIRTYEVATFDDRPQVRLVA